MWWLQFIQAVWPIIVTVVSVASLVLLLWLKSKFPTKTDLAEAEKRISGRIDDHQARLDTGSDKIADLDRRVAVVEEDCDSQPTKNDLNQGQAVLAGRVSGVETAVRGLERQVEGSLRSVEKQVGTTNEYLQILIERGLAGK